MVLSLAALLALSLSAGAAAITCECSGESQSDTATYGSGYGSRCAAWDQFDADTLWPSYGPYEMTADSGDGWACTSWCYVNSSECSGASESWNGNSTLYFTYDSCDDDEHLTSDCPWTGGSHDSCTACSGDSQSDTDMFGSGYGARCAAWDQFEADMLWSSWGPYEMTADSGDGWACTSWCYVDESCGAASTSWNGNSTLYYNYAACDDDEHLTSDCPWTGGSHDSCTACSGDSQSDTDMFGSGYGARCAAWDQFAADMLWVSYGPYEMTADSGDGWACSSWCYVDESCGSASASWSGTETLYFNYDACLDDASLTAGCPWTGGGYDSCMACSGDSQGDTATYGSGYGADCAAWDDATCSTLWPAWGPYEMTCDSGDGWCCSSWCYVDESCGAASTSWNGNSTLYFNYAACDDTVDDGECAWINNDESCAPTAAPTAASSNTVLTSGALPRRISTIVVSFAVIFASSVAVGLGF